jgi:hypothetical protein
MFGLLRRNLLGSKSAWKEVKRRVLTGMLLPILLGGCESWVVTKEMERELAVAHNAMMRGCLRWSLHTTRIHRVTITDMVAALGMQELQHYLDWKILSCAGHVRRVQPQRLPAMMTRCEVEGKRRSGGQTKQHSRQLTESLRRVGVPIEGWQEATADRNEWKKLIKSVDHRGQKSNQRTEPDVFCKIPSAAVGHYVEQKFGSRWHVGVVVSHDIDKENHFCMWKVIFEDGDEGDCDIKELLRVICTDPSEVKILSAAIGPFECAPELALGKPVHKMYKGMLFGGTVQDFELDAATGEQIWGVLYSDGDRADYNLNELRVLM